MNSKHESAMRLLVAMLATVAATAFAGCSPVCRTSDGSTILCICIAGGNDGNCTIDTSGGSGSGDTQGDPEPDSTCSGQTATDEARTFSLATVDLADCPSGFTSRYANSLAEAIQCASQAGTVSTAVDASEVCEYIFTHDCGGSCGGDSGIFARNAEEAERCYRRYYGGCQVRDVTDYARPNGGCRGFTQGIGSWPCP